MSQDALSVSRSHGSHLPDVVQYVRFALSRLTDTNGQHEFEHICRHYARHRITMFILPATGPVGSGGDQGRDFETFRGSRPAADPSTGGQESTIAFGCTIQQAGLPGKLKKDVEKIVSEGKPVDEVHYFCTAPIPVAKRHELVGWCREKKGFELTVHDGEALAEGLAGQDVFWIAEKFLNVPSTLYPPPPDGEEWYRELKEEVREREPNVSRWPDFGKAKRGLRHACRDDSHRQDILFWLSKIDSFCDSDDPAIKRRALYESSYARLNIFRGVGSLTGSEHHADEYLRSLPEEPTLEELSGHSIILCMCLTAVRMGNSGQDADELDVLRRESLAHLDELAAESDISDSRRAELHLCRSNLLLSAPPEDDPFGMLIDCLEEISRLLPNAPLFPLGSYAEIIENFLSRSPGHRRLREMNRQADEIVAKREGGYAAARRRCERAEADLKRGDVLIAAEELHGVREHWFTRETIPQAAAVLSLLGECYKRLGLYHAAKMYLVGSARLLDLGLEDTQHLVGRALMSACRLQYLSGAWAGLLDLLTVANLAHFHLNPHPGETDEEDEMLTESIGLLIDCDTVAAESEPAFLPMIRQMADRLDFGNEFDDLAETARGREIPADAWERFEARPVDDIRVKRRVTWSALGIQWTVEWPNVWAVEHRAEAFAASLQVVQVMLLEETLVLVGHEATIDFGLHDGTDVLVNQNPAAGPTTWTVRWPRQVVSGGAGDSIGQSVVAIMHVLYGLSALPEERLLSVMERLSEEGKMMQLSVGRPHEESMSGFVPEELFNENRRLFVADRSPSPAKENPAMRACVEPGPGYSAAEAEAMIRNRYEMIPAGIPAALATLRESPHFLTIVRELRVEGWKDWHVLQAVFNGVLNTWVGPGYESSDGLEGFQERMLDLQQRLASDGDVGLPPIVPDAITAESMKQFLVGSAGPTMMAWGLRLPRVRFRIEDIIDALARDYRYWDDDVPHDDPFPTEE